MPGRKYGAVVTAKTPPSYHGLSKAEQAKAGKAMAQTLKMYAGKVDILRHYWTSIASGDVSDVIVMEADDPADMHGFQEELERQMIKAGGGDSSKFGMTLDVLFGINPDADAPKKRGRR
jgi:hypothetical protein